MTKRVERWALKSHLVWCNLSQDQHQLGLGGGQLDKRSKGLFVHFTNYTADDFWEADEDEDHDEPEWLDEEREDFRTLHDKNGDGFLDKLEVGKWILPEEDDIQEETEHLIFSADVDKVFPTPSDILEGVAHVLSWM